MQLVSYDKLDTFDGLPVPEHIEVEMEIQEMHNYAEITKEYELTSMDYLSMLGLLHLAIAIVWHIVEWIGSEFIRKATNTSIPETVDEVDRDIEQRIRVLKRKSKQHGANTRKSIIYWLKRNKLFAHTNMAASPFIVAAESAVEIIFWYGLLIIFGTITGYYAYTAIWHFASGSTQIDVQPTTMAIGLPNVTLQLYLPFIILNNYKISVPEYSARSLVSSTFLYDEKDTLVESMTHGPNHNSLEWLMKKWLQDLSKPWTQLITVKKRTNDAIDSFSDERVKQQYEQAYAKHKAVIDQLITDSPKSIHEQARLQEYLAEMNKLFNTSFLMPNIEQAIYKLILLDSIKNGGVPGSQLGGNGNANAGQILKRLNCTVRELFLDTMETLSHVFVVSGGNVMLTDVEFDLVNEGLMLDLHVNMDAETDTTVVSITSSLHTWLSDLKEYRRLHRHYGKPFDANIAVIALDVDAIIEDYFTRKDQPSLALNLIVPNSHMVSSIGQSIAFQDCLIGLKWMYKIPTKTSCFSNSYEWCIKECQLKTYKDTCKCIPWSHYTFDRNAALCHSPCTIDQSQCHENCSKKLCDRYEATVQELFLEEDYPELFKFGLTMQQKLFFQFTEHNQDSWGTFLAKLGNLLDFWMGICTLFLVYFLVYTIKLIAHCIESTKDVRTKQEQLESIREEILTLSTHVTSCLQELSARADAGTLEIKSKSRLSWLRNNSFLETTTITGFGFIAAATSLVEVVMWWIFVMIFSGITINNVYAKIVDYNLRMVTTTTTLSEGNELEFGNFTISFPFSLVELTNEFPTPVRYYYSYYAEGLIGVPIPWALSCLMLNKWYETERMSRETILHRWLNFSQWSSVKLTNKKLHNISYQSVYQQWLARLEHGHVALVDFFEQNNDIAIESEDDVTPYQQLLELLDAPLKERDPNHGFLILQKKIVPVKQIF